MTSTRSKAAARVAAGTATEDHLQLLGDEAVADIKTNGSILQVRAKASKRVALNEATRSITYVVSDETPDRVGDIIAVKGWQIESYKKNPVILWGHDQSIPPIGRGNNVRRRYGAQPRLTADIEFAPAEAHEFADTIYQLAASDFIRATSVGFMPKEVKELSDKERKSLGLGKYGQFYSKSELMEISVVGVPANPAALEEGVKSLMSKGALAESVAPRFVNTYFPEAEIAQKRISDLCKTYIDFGAISKSVTKEDVVEKAKPDELKVGDFVRWSASGGSAMGMIEQIERDGEIDVPDSSFTITGTEDDPAALICLYRDEEKTDTRVGHKFSTLTKIDKPSYASADIDEAETKSPACRQEGETKEECVERKIPELIDEGMEQDQAVAVANSVCETKCDPYKSDEERSLDGVNTKLVNAVASLVEQQAEQTKATRQLVDALSDLTKRLYAPSSGEDRGHSCNHESPDAVEPDAAGERVKQAERASGNAIRGFADAWRRDQRNPQSE